MHRLVVPALAALGLSTLPAAAQEAPDAAGYALCTLTDTGRTPAQVWASPVFEFHVPGNDTTMQTLNRLAGEFHRHVAGLGGAGDKDCVALATRAEAEAFRQEQRAIWDKRVYFVKIGNWHDVAWTPPASLFTAAAPAEKATHYFRCYATTTDVPGRFAAVMTVSSGVFERPVPGERAFVAAQAYQQEFKAVAQANGMPPQSAQCNPYDTAGEADKAERDYRRLFGGFNTKYSVTGWVPSGNAPAPAVPAPAATGGAVAGKAPGGTPAGQGAREIGIHYLDAMTPELAKTLGMPAPQGVFVAAAAADSPFRHMDALLEIAGQAVTAPGEVSAIIARLRPGFEAPVRVWRERGIRELKLVIPAPDAITPTPMTTTAAAAAAPPPATPAPAAPTTPSANAASLPEAMYCIGSVQRSKPPLWLRTPIRRQPTADARHAALGATLSQLFEAAKIAHPGKWRNDDTHCFDTSQVFPGETMCIANSIGYFGGAQSVVVWCNASREALEARAQDMTRIDGGQAQAFDWPAGP